MFGSLQYLHAVDLIATDHGSPFTAKADTAGVHGQRPEALEIGSRVERPTAVAR
jgi:hypothetical protein